MSVDKNKHLDSVITTHKITKEENLLEKHKTRNKEVKEALEEEYKENLYSPFNSGSYAKNTAINTKFDFDLVAPFKRNAFGANGTLKEMYEKVYDFLYDKYDGKEAYVRKQKVSIGIEFYKDADGDVVKIDVVPGREFNQDQYKDDNNLNLYVYYQYGNIDAGSERIKTNIQAQIDNINDRATTEKDSIRKNIRILKDWKVSNNEIYKSFFLELITIKAFDNKDISGDIWTRLKSVMEYIRDEVAKDGFKLIDPGNSGNDVADTLTKDEKSNLSTKMKNMILRIEENSDNIKSYFPENAKFVEEDNQYETKETNNRFSTPPPSTRFG